MNKFKIKRRFVALRSRYRNAAKWLRKQPVLLTILRWLISTSINLAIETMVGNLQS